jgi:hypothetical protein
MERKRDVEKKDDGRRWFINTGGTHRTKDGRIIKPNQKFKEWPENIPDSFKDKITPLEKLPPEPPLEVVVSGYTIKQRSPGWFDVVDGNGKVINEKALRPEDAQKLLNDLSQ